MRMVKKNTAQAFADALKESSLGDSYDFNVNGDGKLEFTAKEAGKTANSILLSQDNAAAVKTAESTTGVDAYSQITKAIGSYTGTGNIEDKIFTVNGEKFAYVDDPASLGDDYKDVNYVKTTGTNGAIAAADADTMAKLINSKTGIAAEQDANANTTVNLKAGTSVSYTHLTLPTT